MTAQLLHFYRERERQRLRSALGDDNEELAALLDVIADVVGDCVHHVDSMSARLLEKQCALLCPLLFQHMPQLAVVQWHGQEQSIPAYARCSPPDHAASLHSCWSIGLVPLYLSEPTILHTADQVVLAVDITVQASCLDLNELDLFITGSSRDYFLYLLMADVVECEWVDVLTEKSSPLTCDHLMSKRLTKSFLDVASLQEPLMQQTMLLLHYPELSYFFTVCDLPGKLEQKTYRLQWRIRQTDCQIRLLQDIQFHVNCSVVASVKSILFDALKMEANEHVVHLPEHDKAIDAITRVVENHHQVLPVSDYHWDKKNHLLFIKPCDKLRRITIQAQRYERVNHSNNTTYAGEDGQAHARVLEPWPVASRKHTTCDDLLPLATCDWQQRFRPQAMKAWLHLLNRNKAHLGWLNQPLNCQLQLQSSFQRGAVAECATVTLTLDESELNAACELMLTRLLAIMIPAHYQVTINLITRQGLHVFHRRRTDGVNE